MKWSSAVGVFVLLAASACAADGGQQGVQVGDIDRKAEPCLHHNGKLVLGESIGDLAGARIAYRALEISRRGQAPMVRKAAQRCEVW